MLWQHSQLTLPNLNDHTGAQMCQVYLFQYSTWSHHSLGFYQDGKLTEYTYGDWQLFALDQRDLLTGLKNMVFHTQGALGKKNIQWQPGQPLCKHFKNCQQVVPFLASREKVAALFNQLETAYDRAQASEVYNKGEEVYFVKYPVPYWLFHNCNHELVRWLEMLGCIIKGRIVFKPDLIAGMEPRLANII
jgi:hypothetical protein